jgi:hypothetical protein
MSNPSASFIESKANKAGTASAENQNMAASFEQPSATYELASADLQVDPSISLGVGAKTGVKFFGQKAGIEVVATIPFSTLDDITNGRPFSLGLKAKIEVEVGSVLVVGELGGKANFQNVQSLPNLEAKGGIGIGLKGDYGPGADIGNGVGRRQTVGGLVGISFEADSRGVRPISGFNGEYTRGKEQVSLLPGISDAIGVQGAIKANARGNPFIAVAGGFGGPAYPGNEVTLSGVGKAYLNIDPVTVQVIAPNGLKLTLKNDDKNGLWTLRQPDGKVIGQLDLPQLAENLRQGTQRMFEQVLTTVPQLKPVADALGIPSQNRHLTTDKVPKQQPVQNVSKSYKPGNYIGIPGRGQLIFKGLKNDGYLHVSSRTGDYRVPTHVGYAKDAVRKWCIDAVKHGGISGLYPEGEVMRLSSSSNHVEANQLTASSIANNKTAQPIIVQRGNEQFAVALNKEGFPAIYSTADMSLPPLATLTKPGTENAVVLLQNTRLFMGQGEPVRSTETQNQPVKSDQQMPLQPALNQMKYA